MINIRDRRRPGWFWADRDIIYKDGKRLGPYGIAIYVALCCHADKEDRAFPSIGTLAAEVGCSEGKARECLRQLETIGWIHCETKYREDGSQTSNRYWLLDSPHAEGGSPHRTGGVHQESPPPTPGEPERESVNKSQLTSSNADRPNIFTVYEQHIGMLTPMISDRLLDIEKTYPVGWFEDAIGEAVMNNKRNLAYVEAILRRWKVEGRGPRNGSRPARDDKAIRHPDGDPVGYSHK